MSTALTHIRTRKLPATDTQCARIKAWTTDTQHQITLPYPYESNEPHALVALTLALKYYPEAGQVQEISCDTSGYKFRVLPYDPEAGL